MSMAWQITGDPVLDSFLFVVLAIIGVCLALLLLIGRK